MTKKHPIIVGTEIREMEAGEEGRCGEERYVCVLCGRGGGGYSA